MNDHHDAAAHTAQYPLTLTGQLCIRIIKTVSHLGDLHLVYLAWIQWYISGKKLKHSQVMWITEEGADHFPFNFAINDKRRHDQFLQILQEGDGKVQF